MEQFLKNRRQMLYEKIILKNPGKSCTALVKHLGQLLENIPGKILKYSWKNPDKDPEKILEKFWKNSGKILEKFWKNSGKILETNQEKKPGKRKNNPDIFFKSQRLWICWNPSFVSCENVCSTCEHQLPSVITLCCCCCCCCRCYCCCCCCRCCCCCFCFYDGESFDGVGQRSGAPQRP